MADCRQRGPVGKRPTTITPKDGTSVRRSTPLPGSVGVETKSEVANEVLRRIKKWRNWADFTGWYPNAVKALDHYLANTGAFVVIPQTKVDSVRKQAEMDHLAKARRAFKRAAVLEAGAAWLAVQGFPILGGELNPKKIDFMLSWQSGKSSGGVTDDNLTYYGSSIMSEVHFQAEQTSIPSDLEDEEFNIHIQVTEWKSWVVDNYDWEGDKQFGFFPKLGLPTQKEMNSLQKSGLAKSYQRSSRSWNMESHDLAAWTEPVSSLKTFQEVAKSRIDTNQQKEKSRESDLRKGSLPVPRPAEEKIKGTVATP